MPSVYRCTCGKAYNLEEGKKYKCKECGAIMQLGAASAPAAPPVPASSAAPSRGPGLRKGAAGKPPLRPSLRAGASAAPGSRATGTRPSLRSERTGERPAPPKSNTGMFLGIGIGVAALIGILFLVMGGEDEAKKAAEMAKIEQAKQAEEARLAAEAAAAKAKAAPKEKKKLTKMEFEELTAQIKTADANRDIKALHSIFQRLLDENIEFDRKPLHYAILRINPQDVMVTKDIGTLERNKLNFDEMDARYRRAEKAKDVKGLYDTVRWVFENNLHSTSDYGLDYLLIYKAILRVDPDDYEARVAAPKASDPRKAPYTGPAQEFKGKLLHSNEFMAVKEIEWRLHKETGIPFLPTEGGGSKP